MTSCAHGDDTVDRGSSPPRPAEPYEAPGGGHNTGRFVFGFVYALLCLLLILIPVKVWGGERADARAVVGIDATESTGD